MTAPVWMAFPPEVHSALLDSGPGPSSLLAAAGAWDALSADYIEVADELTATLGSVQGSAWEGSSAESYVAAHAPFLDWLAQASSTSAASAAQLETAATAYTTALAAMPTLPELAANHATHAVLLATNFFGINTIPIAVNEADYARMWIQAATTMSGYQAVSGAALASTPTTTAAPQIVKAAAAAPPSLPPSVEQALINFLTPIDNAINNLLGPELSQLNPLNYFVSPDGIAQILSYLFNPGTSDPLALLWSDITGDLSPTSGYWASLFEPAIALAGNNPVLLATGLFLASVYTVYDITLEVLQFAINFPLISFGLVPALLAAPVALAGAAGSLAGLAGLAAIPTGVEALPAGPLPAPPSPIPAAMSAPVHAPMVSAPVPAPTPTTAAAPATPPAPPPPAPPPPPAVGAGPFPYLVGGPMPGSAKAAAAAVAKKKAAEPEISAAAVAAAAAAKDKTRARRRRREKAEMRDHGFEYMDLDDDLGSGPDSGSDEYAAATTASGRGTGAFGFTGAGRTERGAASGLTTLPGDDFGGGPTLPMLPGTWSEDPDRGPDAG